MTSASVGSSLWHRGVTVGLYTVKVEAQVNLSLCLTKYHTMRTYGTVEVQFHAFLTLALDGDE